MTDARLDEIASRIGEVKTATLVKGVPDAASYTYELKWDGYRIVALKAGDAVRLVSRGEHDFTREFAAIARDVAALGARECVLDGEVCALDARGMPSFQLLQRRGRARAPLAYFVFDLLLVDGEDLRSRPIEERRARLEALVSCADSRGALVVSSAVDGDPRAILALACERGLEGIVAKKKGSTYASGQRATWLKLKCKLRQELAVIGYVPLTGTRDAVGALLLAVREPDGGFRYVGKVGTGFDDATRLALARTLDRDRATEPTARGLRKLGGVARFAVPKLVAEIELTEWTEGGLLRQPIFRGLRRDKTPEECARETPVVLAEARGGRPDVLGIAISNPDRVLDPTGLTKLELARYYEAIGPWMLPHVDGRPLTLVRWADGRETEKGGVYLRHAKAWGPKELRRVRIREKTKVGTYLVAESLAALVALAQIDVLEIHGWSSRAEDVERPDRLVFDLDPAPDVPWPDVARAARLVRERLAGVGLTSFVKTTGGKGLHVVAPLVPDATWDECFAFTRAFARLLVRTEPSRFVDAVSKRVRHGKIFVDYLRNNRGSTSVAAYSTRARDGAPVSVPIAWDEIDDAGARPPLWTARTVLARVRAAKRDPWGAYAGVRQRLPTR